MPTWHVWLFTLAPFKYVVWIPYVFWCQTLGRMLCQLVTGHWIKKPIILDLRQKWTNYLQSDLDEIWSQLQPKNWWMNKCRHTHKCTGNVPGHITGAGVFSSAPSHTWISSSQNRGKRGGGQNERHAVRGTVDMCCLRTFNSSYNLDAIWGLTPNKSQSKLCDF